MELVTLKTIFSVLVGINTMYSCSKVDVPILIYVSSMDTFI